MLKVAIIGATGYTGRELAGILARHPHVQPTYLTSESFAGQRLSDVYPQFRSVVDVTLEKPDMDKVAECDFIFSALPHGLSVDTVPQLVSTGKKVVDLSGDFRLKDGGLYADWYGYEHNQPQLLANSVYGLPEVNRQQIKKADLVANPGCYPTSVLLALKPLLAEGVVDPQDIIVDAKSGVSGAGRSPKLPFHFPECTENFKAYKVAGHQHTPEIEQELAAVAKEQVLVTFTPHLVPMIRGILSTIYLRTSGKLSETEIWSLFEKHYGDEPFIRLLKAPALPETKFVSGSNFCDISLRLEERTGRLIVLSAIDNLMKGAASQAVQNMNLMMGWPEETGLK
ncbi:N-acetyl-gamma-glutamyl-phosphate reductase [Dethiobacter alkaliphilus]|uniref:N-acetyl-gamma-glutamyl-phosphate reductase n=1 Tax=Dethiobacter alkaliphilus AHT 1 TaxID=555088 RepID=C0GH77_DETAL|nr:N-acetyl-gamma-glutamyl-phosphate reductase [Dethiobacter alkaliphilus]EEG77379.1 N-acetyl-gamma-glutamyl-phosphate reductase [Dethiobacter alkaliphilus AHT 1]